jgi:glutamate-ammonia-ligase adenylyltransferase
MTIPYFYPPRHHRTFASAPTTEADSSHYWQKLIQECSLPEDAAFFRSLTPHAPLYGSPAYALIETLFSCSPYLKRLACQYPQFLRECCEQGATAHADHWRNDLNHQEFATEAAFMAALRRHKAQGALLIALADIAGEWLLGRVTEELTLLAERSLQLSLEYLWKKLETQGHIAPSSAPCEGLIVLGMGKLGAFELNYSSDIDLILLYDPEKIHYIGRQSLQHCLNRFSQDMVRLMNERTAEGYVFRMDLRLRPDPSSTPPVVNLRAAMLYYENVGQNWERAAFIKARPVAGDKTAGATFLAELRPFLWRRSLDFAAIADIQSIKRQMDNRPHGEFTLAGHNIKRGMGGIREIEFIAQIHQLIWGGRNPSLRLRGTCESLKQLEVAGLLEPHLVEMLIAHYHALRMVEHRLQMMEDQQTQTLPENANDRAKLAEFCGFTTHNALQEFDQWMSKILLEVHAVYSSCFNSEPSLSTESGNLSFTGVDLDENTLHTIRGIGFQDAEYVAQHIANWHRGNVRAMRTTRARELLTELTPALLQAFGKTVDPDSAFQHFSRFLERVPAVVQLFSLFLSNPQVLEQLAVIMGNAPALAAHLSRHPDWLDILLASQYHDLLSKPPQPEEYLQASDHEEEWIERLCRFRNEREFLIGTEIIMGKLDPLEGNRQLSTLADVVVTTLINKLREKFAESYGTIPLTGLAVIGLGRLGSNELCFGSDLDLVFLYDAADDSHVSDGEKSYSAVVYYNRLCQRITGGLEAATGEGRLYAVDTRLRPAGKDSPLAISLSGFQKYFQESAWNFEKMALLRHRIIYADPLLAEKLPDIIASLYQTAPDPTTLAQDILEMRERIAKEFPPTNPWRVKHSRGGLLDITFICQYIALRYGQQFPKLLQANNLDILAEAKAQNLLSSLQHHLLEMAWLFQSRLASLLRLCQRDFNEHSAPKGLLNLLTHSFHLQNDSDLKSNLLYHQTNVQQIFDAFLKGTPQ